MSNDNLEMIDETLKERMWSDSGKTPDAKVKCLCAMPFGLMGSKCPKCGSLRVSGAIILETADESDPNILCLECGYWRE